MSTLNTCADMHISSSTFKMLCVAAPVPQARPDGLARVGVASRAAQPTLHFRFSMLQALQKRSYLLRSCIQQQRRTVALIRSSPASGAAVSADTLLDGSVSVVLLAGGVGKRMGAAIPKQYLPLLGRPIATYSLKMFAGMPAVGEVVIVCDPSWRDLFERELPHLPKHVAIRWALPGVERQDSVLSGLQQIRSTAAIVAIHDSARPLVTPLDAARCMADGLAVGAAVLGVPVKPTIKEVGNGQLVVKTLQRARLWEVQTPQCIQPDLLRRGFELVRQQGLEVTDDVSIIEAMGLPVKITTGSYTNIKVTTPDDMFVAEKFLEEASPKAIAAAPA